MLIKIDNIRFNKDNIVSYHPESLNSIVVFTTDGQSKGFAFSSTVKRDAALHELDNAMSQDGFYEIKKA
jgi:hypothetical protein